MSHAQSLPTVAADGADLHRLVVEAEPETNLLLRLLEPFVIHDVLPSRMECATTGDGLAVEIVFAASADLALRLHGRLSVMVGVRDAALSPAGHGRGVHSPEHRAAAHRAA
ncbi:hypothetical protein V5F32_04375 [Xanthobacter oligotrophicus]|uniref:Uncharacterized protein n=1 Tax=Xanthobacter oligotrophicus TaxID=2607286 RepID=A0ABW6ZS18_9HYPH